MKVLILNGSPVYFASANATLVALLHRLFYSIDFDTTMKVGASVIWNARNRTTRCNEFC